MITRVSVVCSFVVQPFFYFFVITLILFNFARMKPDRLSKSLKALPDSLSGMFGRHRKSEYSNPRRYRLDFIAENTFNRVWTIRFSRARVIIVSLTVVAAIAALMFVIIFYTPVSKLLPGRLEGDLRSRYVDMAMRLDSLENRSRANELYITNVRKVISGDIDSVDVTKNTLAAIPRTAVDSMLSPSEDERRFVQLYEASDRFNLSVLTPIAAEGMAFYSPVPDAIIEPEKDETSTFVSFSQPDRLPVSAAYRGTVISVYPDKSGLKTVIVQHPNDFVSVYSGLTDCFTSAGSRVLAGERIGHSGSGNIFKFELWHSGSATDPTEYILF